MIILGWFQRFGMFWIYFMFLSGLQLPSHHINISIHCIYFFLLKIFQQRQVFKTSADSFDQILILFGLSPVVMICNGNMLFFANAWHTLPAKQVESFGEEDHPATRSNHD